MNDIAWKKIGRYILRQELDKKDMSYLDLIAALKAIGIEQTHANVRTKISRGNFSVAFFFQCLAAIGIYKIDFSAYIEIDPIPQKPTK